MRFDANIATALMSGTFMAFLAALTVNNYLQQLIAEVMSILRSLLPDAITGAVGRFRLVDIIVSMLLALLVLALVFSFVIKPVYKNGMFGMK